MRMSAAYSPGPFPMASSPAFFARRNCSPIGRSIIVGAAIAVVPNRSPSGGRFHSVRRRELRRLGRGICWQTRRGRVPRLRTYRSRYRLAQWQIYQRLALAVVKRRRAAPTLARYATPAMRRLAHAISQCRPAPPEHPRALPRLTPIGAVRSVHCKAAHSCICGLECW